MNQQQTVRRSVLNGNTVDRKEADSLYSYITGY